MRGSVRYDNASRSISNSTRMRHAPPHPTTSPMRTTTEQSLATSSISSNASQFRLIETLADRIAQRLLDDFPIDRLKVVVHKPAAVPNARDTHIEIERAR